MRVLSPSGCGLAASSAAPGVADCADASDAPVREAADSFASSGVNPYHLRSVAPLHEFFTGLELVDPGLVPVELWRPDPVTIGTLAEHTGDHAGLARKP